METAQGKAGLSRFRVAGWLVEREGCCIARGDEVLHLRPMLIELLVVLAEKQGQVVAKDEILDRVWSSRFVSESALTRSIAELRHYLGDSAECPTFIETVPKRGYRLIASVHIPDPRPDPLHSAAKRMIAVLPFENLTGEPDQEYFTDGVTEEIITQLGSLHPNDMGVIARTSVMAYKSTRKSLQQIAEELGVEFFLEGSVRREVSRVRITAQLIRAADQIHIWANSYDDDIERLLELQSRVAQSICEAILPKLLPSVKPEPAHEVRVDVVAHEEYLKGLYYWNKFTPEAASRAVEHFQRAIAIEPAYAVAHAALAHVYGMMGYWGYLPPAEVNALARAEALRALQIDGTLASAHGVYGCILCLHDWEYEAGEKELKRAIELNPSEPNNHLWYAMYHALFTENREKAVSEALTSERLDPWSPITALMISSVYILLNDFELAGRQAEKIIGMFPGSLHAYRLRGVAYLGQSLFEHAIAVLEKGAAIARESATVALLAQAYGLSGYAPKARMLIQELLVRSKQEYILPTSIAWAYSGLHDMDSAFEWLERAFQQRCSLLLWMRSGSASMFAPLRSDPRFDQLLIRQNLPNVRRTHPSFDSR